MRQRKSKEEILEEAKLAAFLYSIDTTPQEIALLLDTSEATVTRRLQAAKEKEILIERTEVKLSDKLAGEELRKLSLYPLQGKLREALQHEVGRRCLQAITIVPTETKHQTALENDRETLKRIGQAAAIRLRQHWDTAEKYLLIGVAWGWSVNAVVRAAQRLAPAKNEPTGEEAKDPAFFPVAGDLLLRPEYEEHSYSLSASTLAAELNQVFRGNIRKQLHIPAPAFIPATFLKGKEREDIPAHCDTILEFLQTLPSFQRIFGKKENDQDSLVVKADGILSGVGYWASERIWSRITDHLLDEEKEELENAVLGDVCGKLIPKSNATEYQKKLIDQVNARVFTPTPKQFEACAEKAREQGTPGPIIIANGSLKAEVVHHICLKGWVSEIVVDEDLALKMAELLGLKVCTTNPN